MQVSTCYEIHWAANEDEQGEGKCARARNPENKTFCIVLKLLKTENQRSGAANGLMYYTEN